MSIQAVFNRCGSISSKVDKRADQRRGPVSFGFPDGQPPGGSKASTTFPFDNDDDDDKPSPRKNAQLLREALLDSIGQTGKPVEITILSRLKQNGIDLKDPLSEIDLRIVYTLMRELLGSGADKIMDEAWKYLRKRAKQFTEPKSVYKR